MSDLAWTKAAALLKLIRAEGWPDSLSIERLALLQIGRWDKEAKEIAETLKDACKASRLSCSAQEVTPRPPPRVVYQPSPFASREWAARDFPRPAARPAPPPPVTVYKLRPEVFAGWLAQNKLQPTELVAAWLDATGHRAVAQPTAQAAHEQVQAAGHKKKGRNDAMRPLIEKAQKKADNPEDAAEVFNIIKAWALSKEPPAPLMGDLNPNADAVLWEDSNGVTQALNKKALAKRLGRRRALTAPVPEAGKPKLKRVK
jgi:hypothetical protein